MPVTIYATEADFENFGVGPTLLEDQGITPEMVSRDLEAASRVADGYLSNRDGYPFTLPLLAVGTDVAMYVSWIAAYLLLSSVGYAPENGADNIYDSRYKDAIKWFEGVRDGDISLHGTVGTTPAPPDVNEAARRPVVISGTSRGFSSRGDGNGVIFDLNGPRGGFVGD